MKSEEIKKILDRYEDGFADYIPDSEKEPSVKEFEEIKASWKRIIIAQLKKLFEEEKREMWEEIICPLCYRLNPHHATENDGKGCNWCQDKEDWCGKPSNPAT